MGASDRRGALGEGSGHRPGPGLGAAFGVRHSPGRTRPRRPALSRDAGPARGGERAGERALTGRCRAA